MFASECVDEEERLCKLSGFDQEARAIDFPCGGCFSHVHHPSGGGRMKRRFRFATADFCSLQLSLVAGGVVNFCWLKMWLRTRTNLRARWVEVNYQSLVQSGKMHRPNWCDDRDQENQWRGLIRLCCVAVFLRNQIGRRKFLVTINLISTDGAQEMQKSSSRFPVRRCQLDCENQLRIFTDSHRSKQGRVLDPAHCPFFLSVPLELVPDGSGMFSGGC
jgi:hypothetical protein